MVAVLIDASQPPTPQVTVITRHVQKIRASNFGVTPFPFIYKKHVPPLPPMPHVLLVDFVVLPPGHGRNVTDFWGWDAHEAQLRCPDGVWVVI